MKNQNKRGFTLVELVIVIAVIAILAGVMIATFASVVNDAKESAELQEAQQAELAQKIDDVTKKLENPNWLTWEDFENELAEQLASVNTDESLTADEVKAVVETALNAYAASQANKETGITEDQINLIVERTLAGSMTQAQVESIVKKYSANNLTQAQVSSIVNAAMANNLTAADVRYVVESALANVETDIDAIAATVNNISKNALTKEQVAEIVANYTVNKVVVSGEIKAEDLADLPTGSVVEFAEDATVTENLVINNNITLALNEKTLALGENKITTAEGTTVTISGGTITSAGRAVESDGNIVLNNVVIDSAATDGTAAFKSTNGVLILNNTVIESDSLYTIYAGGCSTVEINGGTYIGTVSNNAKKVSGVQVNANSQLIINGGTFVAPTETTPAIYWPTGTLTINAGEFTADTTVISICGGTVVVNGGTFTTTGTTTVASAAKSGPATDGASVFYVLSSRSASYPMDSVTIYEDNITVVKPDTYELVTEKAGNFTNDGVDNTTEVTNSKVVVK